MVGGGLRSGFGLGLGLGLPCPETLERPLRREYPLYGHVVCRVPGKFTGRQWAPR